MLVVTILGFVIVIALLLYLIKRENHMTKELDRAIASATAEEGKVDSALALIASLADLIRAQKDDPAALTALADSLDAKTAAIQAALDANPLPGEVIPPTPPSA